MKNTKKSTIVQNNRKLFCKEVLDNDLKAKEGLKAEIAVYEILKDKQIMPKIIESRLEENQNYILFEHIDSYNWKQLLNLDFNNKIYLMIKILNKVKIMHENSIIHCDLKTSNILLSKTQVYIVDFETCSINGKLFVKSAGTPECCAPEYASRKIINEQTDIYSLGIILYYLIKGKLPFNGTKEEISKKKINNDFNKTTDCRLNIILNKSINANPSARYKNVQEFIVDLESLISKE